MSASALKTIATGAAVAPPAERPRTIAQLLQSHEVQNQVKLALPRHMTPERLLRICTTELRRTPKLQECDPRSFLGAVIQCAQVGLEPGSALGHVYILPFDKRAKQGGQWVTVATEAQVIIGYRGMIELARRSGQIISIESRAVYEGDRFLCALGLESRLEHVPDWDNPERASGALRYVYAVAHLRDGGRQFEVMSRAEVEAVRARSKAGESGPWKTDYEAMALKTVIRRLFKYLPVSIEVQRMVVADERAEVGLSQELASVIDHDAITHDTASDPPQAEGSATDTAAA